MSTATTFRYTARDRTGATRTGTLDAAEQRLVTAKLREMGYAPVSVTEVKQSSLQKDITLPGLSNKVGLKDLAVFSRQFSTMIGSGVSLVRSLNILAEQTENAKLAEIIGAIRTDVEQGRALSVSMAEHEQFPKLYIAMVKAGEAAGMLDRVLLRVADTMETDLELRRRSSPR